jgi:outer membrane protein W
MLRAFTRTALLLLTFGWLATPASAQVVHSFDLGIGSFMPRGVDTRVTGDVLVANMDALVFKMGDLKSVEVRGEWNLTFGHHIETGFSLGYTQGHAPAFYRDVVNPDGSDITQNLRLRLIPVQAVIRFMPFGKTGTFQPYVGTGVGIVMWRYNETGAFVDSAFNIFNARYTSSGRSVGPILLGGAKIPMGGDIYALTLEARYRYGTGTLDPSQKFAGPKIDLGGLSTEIGFLIRF